MVVNHGLLETYCRESKAVDEKKTVSPEYVDTDKKGLGGRFLESDTSRIMLM